MVGLYLSFIVAFFSVSVEMLCVACAVVLNYFFLASLVAMAGEAVVLYVDLVIVFQEKTRSHVLKVAIITWGVLIVFHRLYNNTRTCF